MSEGFGLLFKRGLSHHPTAYATSEGLGYSVSRRHRSIGAGQDQDRTAAALAFSLVLAAASPPSGRSCWHGHYVGLYETRQGMAHTATQSLGQVSSAGLATIALAGLGLVGDEPPLATGFVSLTGI